MSEYFLKFSGAELDDAINKVRSGYVLPTEVINIASNVSNMDITKGKILNVNVPVAGTIMNCSQYKSETYTSGSSRVALADLTIDIGFKPKIFFIHCTGALYTGMESPYMLTSSIFLYSDDDTEPLQYTTFVLKGDSTNGYGRAGASNGNGFKRTDTGVQGFGTNVVTQKNVTYRWYAWG